jgi:hypothetical protein
MAFLPEMAENQAFEAIFIETIKIIGVPMRCWIGGKIVVFAAKVWGSAKACRVARQA